MTVQDNTPSVTHVGTGAQLSFAFAFRADDIGWLSVDFVADFDQFILNADQDANPGGSAVYFVAPPLAQELTILRDTFNTQELDYTRYDPFDSESHENALDKLTMEIQDLQFYIDTTLTQSLSLLDDVDDSTKQDGSMLYWHAGNAMWQDTAGFMNFVSNILIMNANVLFNNQATHDNRVQIRAGNDLELLDPTNIRAMQMSIDAGFNLNFASTGANLATVNFQNFMGRVMQDLETLAYLSEIPVVISDHTLLSNIGVNTHVQIDSHIADGTIHFSEASIDHTAIANIGINSHPIIDSHIANASIHFTQAGIDHTVIQNIGVNSHLQIDAAITLLNAHIADASIHFPDAPADGSQYARFNNTWTVVAGGGVTDHDLLTNNGGAGSHAVITAHIADASIHYTVGSIDHTLIANIGTNSHAAIDLHIADTNIHFGDAPADAQDYVRNNNAWAVASPGGVTDHDLLTNNGGAGSHAAITAHIADASIHFTVGSIDHTLIANIGVNTHAQIDTHIADSAIHFLEASIDHTAISNIGVNSHAAIDTHIGDGTIHFTVGSIDHTLIANIGVNTHAQIDTHIADGTIHFTVGSIDHTLIANIGTNTHAQIDTHIADANIHYADAPNDASPYVRQSLGWVAATVGDVVGPVVAVDENVAIFDGVTGKLLQDSGVRLIAGSGAGSFEFGAGADADTGTDNIVIGDSAVISGGISGATLIGAQATVSTNFGFALGFSADVNAGVGIAIGYSSTSSGGIAIGGFASAVNGAFCVGNFNTAQCTGLALFGNTTAGGARQVGIYGSVNTTATGVCVIGGSGGGGITQLFLGRNFVNGSQPASVTIAASGGTGSNNAAPSLRLATGVGTGNSAAQTLTLATNTVGASGTVAQSLGARMTLTEALTTVLNDFRVNGDVGFYNQAPVAQPATPVTLADVITALQTLGLTA